MKNYIRDIFIFCICLLTCISCSTHTDENEVGETSPIEGYTIIKTQVRTLSEDTLQRYNPYYFHPNYKPSYALLISEPDITKAVLTKDSLGYDIKVSVPNQEGSTHLRGCMFSPSQSNDGTISIREDLVNNDFANQKALQLILLGSNYVSNGMYYDGMKAYKEAEAELELNPEINSSMLADVKTAIAQLHNYIYSDSDAVISKFTEAIKECRQKGGDARLPMLYTNLATAYMFTQYTDSARFCLRESLRLAKLYSIRNNTIEIVNFTLLMAINNLEGKYDKSLILGQRIKTQTYEPNVTYRLAETYLGLDNLKEARSYYDKYCKDWSKIKEYVFLSDYYTKTGEYEKALEYEMLETKFTDSVRLSRTSQNVSNLEQVYNHQKALIEKQASDIKSRSRLFIILGMIMVLGLTISIIIIFIQKRRRENESYNSLIEQMQNEKSSLQSLIQTVKENQKQEDAKLMESLQHRLDTTDKLLSSSYQFIDYPEKFVKHFKEAMELDKTATSNLDDILTIINRQYNNIIDRIKEDYPNITRDEERLLALVCAKYSTMSIAVLFNSTNLGTIYNKKSRLLKKLGTPMTLEQFIEGYKNL